MKKVVIIGGGFAGAYSAINLENHFDITLIDTKDYFEFTPGVLRCIVEPEHAEKIQSLHKNYLKKSKIVVGKVIDIRDRKVITYKDKIPFDYLIICSGSSYNAPFKEKNIVIGTRGKNLIESYKRVKDADHILIIGGGLVGVEIASEIMEKYPEKQMTIVHSQESLIQRNPIKAIRHAEDYFRNHNVELIKNERVIRKDGKYYITDKGSKIYADLAFLSTGISPNFEFLRKNYGHCLSEKNFLKVNDFLQLEGEKDIFAAGDIAEIREEKTAQNAEYHARVVVENIRRSEKGKELMKYKKAARVMVISLGKNDGILTYKKGVLTGIIPGILKSIVEWKEMRRFR